MDIDKTALRKALGHFATGVAIVGVRGAEDEPIGLTVSSFNSVSLDPPLVLFSVDRRSRSLEALRNAEGYVISILSRSQEAAASLFGRPLHAKWDGVDHLVGHARAPMIANAMAYFDCAPYASYDGGDHTILVGRVIRCHADETAQPLLFFRGKYRSVFQES